MDHWSRRWRNLVEWDDDNKVYLYKGHKIYPLSYKEQIEMPTHIQNSYYWGEIKHIDKVVKEKREPNSNGQKELQEALNMFLKSVGM